MPSCPLACLPGRTPVSPPTLARLLARPPARPPARHLPARHLPARPPASRLARPLARSRARPLAWSPTDASPTGASAHVFVRAGFSSLAAALPARAPLASLRSRAPCLLGSCVAEYAPTTLVKTNPLFPPRPGLQNQCCMSSLAAARRSINLSTSRSSPSNIDSGAHGGRKTTRKKGVSFDEGCSRKRTGRGTRWIIAVLLEP